MTSVQERLQLLRQKMREKGVSVYVIPSADCHLSEYVCEHFRTRAFITGFTGSAGSAVVTLQEAGLWTDGRYFIQAEEELSGSEFVLYRMGEPGVPAVEDYVEEQLQKGELLGFDGRVMDARWAEKLKAAADRKEAALLVTEDLAGDVWAGRPSIPDAPVFVLEECWTGESTERKLVRVREKMKEQGADVHVITSLCDIAWLLNLRGGDIPCVPVVLSFLCMTEDSCCWYVRPSVVTDELCAYLEKNRVQVRIYDEIYSDLEKINPGQRVLLDRKNVNYRLISSLKEGVEIQDHSNPTELMKAVKNETELANLRTAHVKEGVALTRFMYWLKTRVGKEEMTELSVSDYLEKLRGQQEYYLGPSFHTICGYGVHGAIVHYHATEKTNAAVRPEGFLLVDAGGNYLDGTTDTTRTFAMGPLSEEQKRMFTAVCRGNLRLANARFLYGCTGYNLDVLCREPLWQMGMDYKHGTGHGVGYLLNVHEGPNAFRWKVPAGETPAVLEAGMVTSDEPGIYLEGKFGIRTENELVCVKQEANEYGQFMGFEVLTLVPIDLDAIVPEQMSPMERGWLNAYHRRVYHTLKPYLSEEECRWLEIYTREI